MAHVPRRTSLWRQGSLRVFIIEIEKCMFLALNDGKYAPTQRVMMKLTSYMNKFFVGKASAWGRWMAS